MTAQGDDVQSVSESMSATAQALEARFEGFSCPFEPMDENLLPVIVAEYSRGIARLFLAQHGDELGNQSEGLITALQPWIDGRVVPGVGWDPCFGEVYRVLHGNFAAGSRVTIAAGIGTHLAACGLPGQWEATLDRPIQFRWDTLLLPPATRIRVETTGTNARVVTTTGETNTELWLEQTTEGWRSEKAESLPEVTLLGLTMKLLPQRALAMKDFDDLILSALPTIDPRMVVVFDEAVKIIDQYANPYLSWIRRTLHHVFLLFPRTDTIESGSVEHFLGLIHMSAHANPLPVAELLAHEASHQYMNVLTKLGPIDDGSDTNMYYSPPVNKHRKISLIVAAYHAFSNVLLFYRLCYQNGIADRRECERQEALLVPWLEQLERPLRDNPALTPIGRALWRPLQARIWKH